mgnify:CR=1 FL=1
MFERGISPEDVRHVLDDGQAIEQYPNDTPYPSRLVLGWCGDRPLHVVAADLPGGQETIVVTVYEPDAIRWVAGFTKRKPS